MIVLIIPCRTCGRTTVPRPVYRRVPWLREQHAARTGRGLCDTCYMRARHNGTLADHERSSLSRDELLDDYRMLREQGHTIRQIADRLGISLYALRRALTRAHNDGDPRATHRPGGGW